MSAPDQSWSKLYDGWYHHHKFVEAGPVAAGLYFAGQAYCSAQETDGLIPKKVVSGFFPETISRQKLSQTVQILNTFGLWEDHESHWKQHNYEDMQRTTEDKEVVRAQARERQRRHRQNGKVTDVSRVTNALVTEQSRVEESRVESTDPKGSVDIPQDDQQEQKDHSSPEDPIQPQDHSSDSKPAVVPSEGPKKKPVYDESNSYHADIVALFDEFYAAKDHRPPSASAKPKVMNEVRLILVKDMADEEPDRRVPRLRAILQGAATDDFWQSKIRSLTGLRTVSQRNGCLKWENCEAGLSSGPKWTSLKPQRQRERRQEAYQR